MTKEELENNVLIKRIIQLKIVEADKTKSKELIEKYKNSEHTMMNTNQQRMMIGGLIDTAVNAGKKGATEEEIDNIIEHIVVVMHAIKDNLDILSSIKEHNLLEIVEKYKN